MSNPELIACSKAITIHSLDSKQPICSYTHHRGIINYATANHNNKVIASCGQDGKIFLVSSEKPENKLVQHSFYTNLKDKIYALNSCVFSPNSKYLAVGSIDSLIKIWDLRGDKNGLKEMPAVIKSHMGGVTSLAWLRYLKCQGATSQTLASSSSSGDIYIHSNKNGVYSELMSFKLQQGINCIKTTEKEDYCRLAACTNGGSLAVWDLLSGSNKPNWTTTWNSDRKPSLNSLSFSPFSPVLLAAASSDNSLIFYDIHQKKSVKTIPTQQSLTSLGLHSNGHTLVAGGMFGSILVYDLRSPTKPLSKLLGHETTIKNLQFYKPKQSKEPVILDQKPKYSTSANQASNMSKQIQGPSVRDTAPLQTKTNNYIEGKRQSNNDQKIIPSLNNRETVIPYRQMYNRQELKQKLPENNKLSSTGQQVIRNAAMNGIAKNSQLFSQSAGQFYRNRPKQPIKNENVPVPAFDNDPLRKEISQLKTGFIQIKKQQQELKNLVYDFEQRMNLSMIRQFQLHQQQMRRMMEALLSHQKQKEDKIKKLEAENKKLRENVQ